MKKFLSSALIMAMLAATVTGCSNNNNSSSTGDSSSGTSSSAPADSSADDSSSAPAGESQPSESASLTAKDMAANVLNAQEWPSLMPITDNETAAIMGIDLSLCEDYFIAMPMMSAHVTEIIIAKPVAGQEAALQEQIDTRYAYVQENGAFYPDNEKVVAGAVTGKTDDGYIYAIVHEYGQDCADAMLTTPAAELPSQYNPDAAPEADAGVTEGLNAEAMAANVLNVTEWPMLMVADAEMASAIGIDVSLCEDYFIAMPAMSAHITEIIICKPSAGNEEALEAQLDARYAYIEEQGAFYPMNEVVVAGMVTGFTDNGYMYTIVHENGQACADAMMNEPAAELPENYRAN